MRRGHRNASLIGGTPGRRGALVLLATLPASCASLSALDAARLAQDGEAAADRLVAEAAKAHRRVEGARDLLLIRAALAAAPGTTPDALRARPEVAAADRRLERAAEILARGREALEGLRGSYRAFAEVAAGRNPEAFDAMLDRAAEDAEAVRTIIERHAAEESRLVEALPGGETVLGVLRFAGGLVGRARTGRSLVEPNAALIALLDSLVAAADEEAAAIGPLLAAVAADRGEDVAAALRRAGVVRAGTATALDRLAETFGWSASPLADPRLREGQAWRLALGLRAAEDRRPRAEPSRLIDPAASRAVLVALRDRHLALRRRSLADPAALRDSLRRLAG